MASTVGMMDPAFFVGRNELISWVNGLLGLNLTKVEQCASGAVYCQIMDACHNGVVPMHRVNFEAKGEHEYVNNYKVLQVVFERLKIARNVEVTRLVKGRPLDNLEFLQWMKCYYDKTTGGGALVDGGYDAEERRAHARGGAAFVGAKKASVMTNGGQRAGGRARADKSRTHAHADRERERGGAGSTRGHRDAVAGNSVPVGMSSRTATGGSAATSAQVRELTEANTALELQVERAEQEREFYFEKLQDVEYLCQRPEFANNPLTKVVEKILYHTDGKADVDAIIAECLPNVVKEANETAAETRAAEESQPEPAVEPTPPVEEPTPVEAVTATLTALSLERADSVRTLGASPLGTPPPMYDEEDTTSDAHQNGGEQPQRRIPPPSPKYFKSPLPPSSARTPLGEANNNSV
jgi:RP/EB family microtubule-associated protein